MLAHSEQCPFSAALASGSTALTALLRAAERRIIPLIRLGLVATLVFLPVQLESEAYAAGGWSGMASRGTLVAILSARCGVLWLVSLTLTVLTLVTLSGPVVRGLRRTVRTVPQGSTTLPVDERGGTTHPAPVGHLSVTATEPAMWVATFLGLTYLLALACSGHAATVPQMVASSVFLDLLHLVAMTVWIGGMAAIALALVPAVRDLRTSGALDGSADRLALLTLLDRYSPAAFIAVIVVAFTGMFNAQVHLNSLDQVTGTDYGRLLVVKLVLLAVIMLLSASHVFLTRPQLRPLLVAGNTAAERDYASLAARLRVEPVLGGLVLLCAALMVQVAPAVKVFAAPAVSGPTARATSMPSDGMATATLRAIAGSAMSGALHATLTISSPMLGHTRFHVAIAQHGRPVVDGQVRIRLTVPGQPALGTSFVETTPAAGGYDGAGDLAQNGQWRADLLVRTRDDPGEYRDVPLDFMAGPGATFLGQSSNRLSP